MIRVTASLFIGEKELEEHFIRASGPGGQKVNKTATAVQLRYDLCASSLPPEVRERLRRIAGKRVDKDGVLVLEARRFRTQSRNRDDALSRLVKLIRRAAEKPRRRRRTRPSRSAIEKRLEDKRHRAQTKERRAAPREDGK